MSPDRKPEIQNNKINLNRALRIIFTSSSLGSFIVVLNILIGDPILRNPTPNITTTIAVGSFGVFSWAIAEYSHQAIKVLESKSI